MDGFADWYLNGRLAHHMTEHHRVGDAPVTLMSARQPTGDMSDPPVSDLVLGIFKRNSFRATCDFGAGRFRASAGPNSLYCVAPGTPTEIMVDDPHELRLIAFDRALATEHLGLDTADDLDFGHLHRSFFQSPLLAHLFDALWEEHRIGNAASRLFVDSASVAILAALARLAQRASDSNARIGALPDWRVRRATELMGEHVDGALSLTDLATSVGLSSFHFCRSFKAATGVTPNRWLTQLRIARAQDMLIDRERSITEIALDLGYSSHSAFGAAFRRQTGMTPREWRRAVQ